MFLKELTRIGMLIQFSTAYLLQMKLSKLMANPLADICDAVGLLHRLRTHRPCSFFLMAFWPVLNIFLS